MFNEGDIKFIAGEGSGRKCRVDDRTTSSASATIKPGEPIKRSNGNFALVVETGDPEIGTDILLGLAKNESTETSSAEGTVEFNLIVPGSILQGKMTTPANGDADSELKAFELDYVAFDVNAGVITIDEDEGDDPNVHGLFILGGDIVKGTLDVAVHVNVTIFGSLVGQTID